MTRVARLLLCCSLLCSAAGVRAADPPADEAGVRLDESYGDAFLHYHPYVSPGKKPESQKRPTPTAPPAPTTSDAPPKPEGKQKVDVAWLRKNYQLLEDRAIDNPSEENVSAYLYVKRVVLDKSQRFGEAVDKVMRQDPLLNENNRVPYASTGARSVKNANLLAEQQAVRELAGVGGLLVFVDGACRFCAMQLPVVSMVQKGYGLEYLVISVDGSTPKGYTGKVLPDNGMFKKLGLHLTPSIVYVPKPRAYAGVVDPNAYLIVAQGFYAVDELVKQVAFAGHSTKLLSKDTMAGLDIWDRGVASKEDLGELRLDPSQPADIKETLQPLLLKQY